MMDTLTKRVLEYQKGMLDEKVLMDELLVIVYEFPEKSLHWAEEDKSAFLLAFYPRISRLLELFEYKGYSFRTYFNNTLNWYSKTFLRNRLKQKTLETCTLDQDHGSRDRTVALNDCNDDFTSILNYFYRHLPEERRDRSRSSYVNGVLYCLLQQCYYLDDKNVQDICCLYGLKPDRVYRIIEKCKEAVRGRKEKREILEQRKNGLYLSLKSVQFKLAMNQDEHQAEYLHERCLTIKDRIKRIERQLEGMNLTPTYNELADILELPRGTVSSAIYKFKKKAKTLYQQTSFRYVHYYGNTCCDKQSS